ncbi:MAG: N-6 DNA methylase [Candidatus Cloacimonetes bacterium]|nr:N-6 DNA methylase [Candidatus Cloacimonadota bacterium]
MDYNEVKRKIDTARDILVGKIPVPKSQIDLITITLIYKFMDDMDRFSEELGGGAVYFVGDYEKYGWSELMSGGLSGRERFDLFTEGLVRMENNPHIPQLFRLIFKGAYLPFRDEKTLNMFLSEINGFEYDHSEKLGDAFEYLLSVMGAQGDAGQFRTPRHIIDFIVEAVDPQKTDKILDPACGTAGFLISAYKYIMQKNSEKSYGDKMKSDDRKRLVENISGYDISPDMVKLSLVNMFLHRFPDPHIYEYDTLSSEDRWDENFAIILANPPFMTPKGGIVPHQQFSLKSNRSEVLFVDYIMEHLTLDGKAGVIVPEGIIFQSQNAHKNLRKKLIEENYLWAVVSLPSGVFNPYAGVKTSILLMDRRMAKQRDELLFINIKNDGYNLGAQRTQIKDNDLIEALAIIKEYKLNKKLPENCEIAQLVPKIKVIENEYNLSANRYIEEAVYTGKWEMVELGDIVEFKYGKSLPERDRLNGIYPVYGSNGVVGHHNEFIAKAPFIIIGRKGSAGEVKYSNDNGYPIDTTFFIDEMKKQGSLKYLFYVLRSLDLKNTNIQSGIPGLNRNDAYKIKIPLPPLKIQEEIVEEIEGYEKIIEGARQVVENYKPHIDIDPGWEVVELGELCIDTLGGGTPSTKIEEYWTGDIPWITSADIVDFHHAKPRKYITERAIKESATHLIPKGNIIVVTRVGLGKLFLNDFDVCISQDSQGLIINKAKVNPEYLLYILIEKVLTFIENSRGATIKGVTKDQLSRLKIPLPSIEKQKGIVLKIQSINNSINGCEILIKVYKNKIEEVINRLWKK